ncbi:MAG TPA: hypothetical protein IAA74_08820 [Candidatus Excrementavichristensenella intestinipullorum]|nr:hypothetical protein [Candidatus Excrementavichristensenella intestinipullorum]
MSKVVPFERGSEYLLHRVRINRRAGRLLDALALQRRALEQEDTPACRMDLAQILCQMGCYEESNRILAGILGMGDPPNDCYFGLCCNYMGMGQHELAYRSMVQFLSQDPSATGRPEVSRIFRDLLRIRFIQMRRPGNRGAYRSSLLVEAAWLRNARGEEALAQRLLTRALRALKGRQTGPVRAQLAQVLVQRGMPEAAAVQMDRALAQPQAPDEVLGAAARVYGRAGQWDKARSALQRLEGRKPRGKGLRVLLDACCDVKDDERVRLLAPRALGESPYDRKLLHQCAVNRVREGRPVEQAVSFWTRILRIDPQDVVARWNLRQAALGKLDRSMSYDYDLPPEEARRWKHQLCQALWLDDAALEERFQRSHALEDRCRWALFGMDYQAQLMARRLLARINDPAARRLLHESMALPVTAIQASENGWVSPDVNTVTVPPALRRPMKDALWEVQRRHGNLTHRVVHLVMMFLTQGKNRMPRDGRAVAAALYFLAVGDQEDAPTLNQAAALFDVCPRRAARCALLLGGEKETEEKHDQTD